MKFMFVASIRGKKDNAQAYEKIVSTLQQDGNTVIFDHVLSFSQENLTKMTKAENIAFHKKILQSMKTSDVVVSECSTQSLSVGYLLSHAVELGKPTIVFYNSKAPEPNLFPTLSTSEKLFFVKYESIEELGQLIIDYAEYAKEQLDTRFNFFVSPKIERFLSWISKHRKIPRSVFLRKLIEEAMIKDKEYKDEA